MNETAVTKLCKLCTVSFIPAGNQINCTHCGALSGDAHKAANQLKKAFKLAETFGKHGISAPALSEMTDERYAGVWLMAAELAGVTVPSEVTMALTLTLLAGASE